MIMGIDTESTQSQVYVPILINGVQAKPLLDTGSTMSHVSNDFSEQLKLNLKDSDCCFGLAVKGCTSKCLGKCL